MKKIVSILIALVLGVIVKSQVFNETFNYNPTLYSHPANNYSQYGDEAFFTILSTSEQELVMLGSHSNPNWSDSSFVSTYYVKANMSGNVIEEKLLNLEPYYATIVSNYVNINEKNVVFGYVRDYSSNSPYGAIAILESDSLQNSQIFEYGKDTKFVDGTVGDKLYILGFSDVDTSTEVNYEFIVTVFDTASLEPLDTLIFGQDEVDAPRSISLLSNGNLLLYGYSENIDSNNLDFYAIEVDTQGNIIWENYYGFQGDDRNSNQDVVVVDNEFYLCGWIEVNNLDKAAWLIKIDSNGDLIWEKQFDRGSLFEGFTDISFSEDSSLVLTGSTHNYSISGSPPTGWLIKTDLQGNLIWERFPSVYNGQNNSDDYLNEILIKNNEIFSGGYVISSSTDNNGFFLSNDAWLYKTDSCGYSVGAQPNALLSIDSIVGSQVYISNLSSSYCSGKLQISIVDPLSGDTNLVDLIDLYAYSEDFGGQSSLQLTYTLPDTGTFVFNLLTYAGDGLDSFSLSIMVSDTSTNILSRISHEVDYSIYPNPSSDYLIIRFNNSHEDLKGCIFDLSGRILNSFEISSSQRQKYIGVNDLSNGVYMLTLQNPNGQVGIDKFSIVK